MTNFKPYLFTVKKDRKNGIIITSPRIRWENLSPENSKIQWSYCISVLHTLEKDGDMSHDILLEKLYQFLPTVGFTKEQIILIKKLKEQDIAYSFLSVVFMIHSGAIYEPANDFFLIKMRELLKKAKNIVSIQQTIKRDTTRDQYDQLIDEIQGMEDEIFTKKVIFSDWIKEKRVSKPILDKVALFFRPRLSEIFELYDKSCPQLNEAYDHLTKDQIKYMIKWYNSLINTLESVPIKQTTIKTRKIKPKTPGKLVKNLRYLFSSSEYKISSISPEKIISSTILWAYNTKTRKLYEIQAKIGEKLSVQGTSIINYDEDLSSSKTLRKPELQLKELLAGGKAFMHKYYDTIKSKGSPISGRINSDILLLKVF